MMQRGYNLVEAAIVLTVLGLLLGGALVPLQERFRTEEIKSTERIVREAKAAVYTYALKSRTAGKRLTYYNGVQYPVPAGRPYLPCPDIDYDGVEDRSAAPTSYAFTLSASIGGGCEETKGLLPWKTLGLRGVDAWGNHLTYRVDYRYANEWLGFDETFIADVFDIHADTPGGLYATLAVTAEQNMPAVICTNFNVSAVAGAPLVGCPDADLSNVEAGVIITGTLAAAITLGARQIPPLTVGAPNTGIIEGMVFVILSHGPDGAGAVGTGGNCHTGPAATRDLGERANAYYRTAHPFRATPFNCPDLSGGGISPLYEHLFVSRPMTNIHNADLDGPDDIVVWSGRNELLGYLARNGMFPVDKLDYLPR